jgi:hypothetical protein
MGSTLHIRYTYKMCNKIEILSIHKTIHKTQDTRQDKTRQDHNEHLHSLIDTLRNCDVYDG